jgi:hypothetical protein
MFRTPLAVRGTGCRDGTSRRDCTRRRHVTPMSEVLVRLGYRHGCPDVGVARYV